MDEVYKRALEVMTENFGHANTFAIATKSSDGNVTVRELYGYYKNGKIYMLGHLRDRKMTNIATWNQVALCSRATIMSGKARSIGHPLDEANAALRKELRRELEPVYRDFADEKDPGTCILEITLEQAETYTRVHRYQIDFVAETATRDHSIHQYLYYK